MAVAAVRAGGQQAATKSKLPRPPPTRSARRRAPHDQGQRNSRKRGRAQQGRDVARRPRPCPCRQTLPPSLATAPEDRREPDPGPDRDRRTGKLEQPAVRLHPPVAALRTRGPGLPADRRGHIASATRSPARTSVTRSCSEETATNAAGSTAGLLQAERGRSRGRARRHPAADDQRQRPAGPDAGRRPRPVEQRTHRPTATSGSGATRRARQCKPISGAVARA